MPMHVALGGAGEDEELTLRLLQNGSARLSSQVRAERGYVMTTLRGSATAGRATLEVIRNGTVLAQRQIHVVTAAETQPVKVAWVSKGHENLVLETRRFLARHRLVPLPSTNYCGDPIRRVHSAPPCQLHPRSLVSRGVQRDGDRVYSS